VKECLEVEAGAWQYILTCWPAAAAKTKEEGKSIVQLSCFFERGSVLDSRLKGCLAETLLLVLMDNQVQGNNALHPSLRHKI